MQSDVAVSGNKITGTLIKQTTGVPAEYWGPGYFIGLKFTPDSDATTTKVGLSPSMGSGMVALDEDNLAMFKITDKDGQGLRISGELPLSFSALPYSSHELEAAYHH